MNAQPLPTPRFIRKTQLGAGEYRKNFHQIDQDIIAAITSPEADAVTPLMSKIYLRLVNAPAGYWEQTGVLRFEAEIRENKHVKAWLVFCEVAGVASATAHKALVWLHEQGIIGYFSGKNGVGLRIFLNRASTSIGTRTGSADKKILQFGRVSSAERPASSDETAFSDSYAVKEIQDTDLSSGAPKTGADTKSVDKLTSTPPTPDTRTGIRSAVELHEVAAESAGAQHIPLGEIIARLKSEIEPGLKSAAAQAAAQATRCEIERTRTWFETKALPKAVRVAQSECYSLLKKHGSLEEKSQRLRAGLAVGRHVPSEVMETARARTSQEISEMAEACLALLETQGQSIEVTLSEMSSEGGGWLLPEDAPRIRAAAELMLAERERRA
ncbi:MAG: hypothetical protein H0T60_10160 [Acidobacteria bacterium]|nr:hypothetical protein [Acidobacteriota bacterium]